MNTKRKISIRKVLQAVFTLVLTIGCIAAILSASKMQQEERVKNISLHVKNEMQYQFLDKQLLLSSIKNDNHLIANKTRLAAINLKKIEQDVYKNPWVAEAQVYIDNQRNMHIYATQHTPVARIFFENGQSYYLNDSLKLLPVSDKFTYYTTTVTNVPWFNNDSMNKVARAQIVSLIRTVANDSFWNAQIEQISMTPDMEFEIYPVLGTHKILFGDTIMAKRKFENVFAFYKNILNKIGWDKYQILDARYKDQVIASPALAWKMPPKGFISNMDWVKTIMGDEPKTNSNTSLQITTSQATIPSTTQTAAPVKTTTTLMKNATATTQAKPKEQPKPTAIKKQEHSVDQPGTQTQQKAKTTTDKKESSPQKPKYILN